MQNRKLFSKKYEIDRCVFEHIAECEVKGINPIGSNIIRSNSERKINVYDVMDFFVLTGEQYDVCVDKHCNLIN